MADYAKRFFLLAETAHPLPPRPISSKSAAPRGRPPSFDLEQEILVVTGVFQRQQALNLAFTKAGAVSSSSALSVANKENSSAYFF